MSLKPLWAPWRMEYLESEKPEDGGCVLCQVIEQTDADREHLVLHRAKHSYLVLNKYPYNNGHLMAVPKAHVSDLTRLDTEGLLELSQLTRLCVQLLTEVYRPEGFNIGMNLGAAAGAGIREHMHMHIVPRWSGDTNFMPVVADTKSMPQHLMESYDRLRDALADPSKEYTDKV